MIHDDEVTHAATSWAIVRWALDQDPSIIVELRRALASHTVELDARHGPSTPEGQRFGLGCPRRAAEQSAEFIATIVWPVFETLACRVAARAVA